MWLMYGVRGQGSQGVTGHAALGLGPSFLPSQKLTGVCVCVCVCVSMWVWVALQIPTRSLSQIQVHARSYLDNGDKPPNRTCRDRHTPPRNAAVRV